MSLTLLVENNPRIEACYALNLSTWLDLQVQVATTTEAAISYLYTEQAPIKLIIARKSIENKSCAKLILESLKQKGLQIPLIEVGPGDSIPGCAASIPNSLDIKLLIQSAAKALAITAQEMSNKIVPDLFPVHIQFFRIKNACCSIYLQESKDPSKYELKFNKLDLIQEEDINTLLQKGVTELFVHKLDRLEFVNFVTSELITQLDRKDLSLDEEISATGMSIQHLTKKIMSIGINEETVKLAHKNMDTMRRNVKSNPKLSKLLNRMLSNKTSYLFKHTQILTYVGLHIIKNIDWGNTEQEAKICFMAFFHDIVLENDQQAVIKSKLELKKAKLDPTQESLVEKHAQMAAELVAKFPHAPMGSDQLIRQHHGTLNGIGFSEHYGANVSPMAIVFIVAEEFTKIILKYEQGPFDIIEMIRELKEEFPTFRFQKVIETLETITF